MKGFTKLPRTYFQKYSNSPVKIIPFNPRSQISAKEYIKRLKSLLSKFKVDILLRGSTAFGIAGKGEIEIGVYPLKKDWKEIINILKNNFGAINNLEENYARFNDKFEGFEIEIILLKGYDAIVDKKLTEYMRSSPEVLKKYEKIKKRYSYSKREYMLQKNRFFEDLVKGL